MTQGVIVEQDKDEKVVHNTDYFLFLKFDFVWNLFILLCISI